MNVTWVISGSILTPACGGFGLIHGLGWKVGKASDLCCCSSSSNTGKAGCLYGGCGSFRFHVDHQILQP